MQNTDLPLTHSVSVPAQRSSDENDQTPDAAEQLQQTLRTVLADELRDLLAAMAGIQQSQTSALDEQRRELAEIRGELVALAADLEGWQVRQTATGQDTDAPEVTEDHSILLQQAARISSAVLVCHRDMWDFVAANAGRHPPLPHPAANHRPRRRARQHHRLRPLRPSPAAP